MLNFAINHNPSTSSDGSKSGKIKINRLIYFLTNLNRSFHIDLGTFPRVITPLTVSCRTSQVSLKLTCLGFKDILV